MDEARAPNYELAEIDYINGMKYIEIATKYGVTLNTVKSWKTRYKWEKNTKKSVHTKKEKVCTQKQEADIEEIEMRDGEELTDKQWLFCVYYSKSFNATRSYQKAYNCKYETALVNGSRMLGNARIKEEIHTLKEKRYAKEMLKPEDIFQKYMDIAFADITDFVEFGTEQVPVMGMYGPVQIKDEKTGKKKTLMQTVNTMRFRNSDEIDGSLLSEIKQGKNGESIKLKDSMKALEWLANHMDLATEEQKARIALLKVKADFNETETEDDGFLEALQGKVSEIWQDE